MAKDRNTIIIISDDELDDAPPIVQHATKTPIQKLGQSKANPIDLDMDDDDQIQVWSTGDQINQPSATKYEVNGSSINTSKNDEINGLSAMEIDSSSTLLSSSIASSLLQSWHSDPAYGTASKILGSSIASSLLQSWHNDPAYGNASKILGLSPDVLDYISNQHAIEPEIFMEDEPDWSYIANLGTNEVSPPWEPPHQVYMPNDTKVPEGMCLNEFLTRFDYYQYSMNQYVEGLQPTPHKRKLLLDKTPSPSSSTTLSPLSPIIGRNSLKRSSAISQSLVVSTVNTHKVDYQAAYTRLTDPASYLTIQRPYVPVAVWQGSNWEDWAQFSVGDLIHVPFTAHEDFMVTKVARRMMDRRRRSTPTALMDNIGAWSEASSLLPGREPQDCCFRYMDISRAKGHLFSKPQLITTAKPPSKSLQSFHDLLVTRQIRGKGNMNRYHSVVWKNLGNEITVGEGSGDASCLLLEGDIRKTDNIQLIAGSLCDDNQSYNMEGNLREWRSSTGKVTQLKGHYNEVVTADGGAQLSWRTVHDIKVSNDKSLIFSASRDGKAKIWNRASRKLVATLVCHNGPVHQIAVKSGPENVIATGSSDGSGVIWNITHGGKTGKGDVCTTEVVDDLDHCSVECLEFGHGASDNRLFMGYRTEIIDNLGWITVFDALTTTPLYNIRNMRGSVGCMAISQSGKHLLSGNDSIDGGDQLLHVNDVITGQSILQARTGHLDVNCVAFSRCDNYIASGSVNNQVTIFDMRKSSKPVYEFVHDNTRQNNGRFIAPDAGIGISGMYWMKNNNILITAGGDCAVNLWDVSGGDGLLKSYRTADPISCLAVNEDIYTLAAGASGAQGLVHIWRP